MSQARAFVEAPAGLAAVSLRLHGGPHCRPPISRMGNKAGYAEVILAALGLRSGEGAGAYVWCESDRDVAALLRAYPDPAMLTRIAEIIRGWAGEEPRALWERLRAERKARAVDEAPDLPGWMWSLGNTSPFMTQYRARRWDASGEAQLPAGVLSDRCTRLASYAQIVASNRLINVAGPELRNTGEGGTTFGGAAFATPAEDVAAGFERVAGWIVTGAWAMRRGQPDSGYTESRTDVGIGEGHGDGAEAIANRCERNASRWPPVHVSPTLLDADALSALLGTPGDLEGVVVYADPDYRDTTGYASTCRDLIPDLARGWDAMGAVVCISEAVPIPELPGWHATEITAGRKGQKRTFSKQQQEWLTMNREPAHRVASQMGLF